MSRMAEHWQAEQDDLPDDDLAECERWHHEQAILKADPAWHDFLESINQRNARDYPPPTPENFDDDRNSH
jgi:hypothetical protein